MIKNKKILVSILLFIPLAGFAQKDGISLQECLEISRANNPEVRNAALDASSARAVKGEAMANWFPSVSAMGFGFNAFNPFVKVGVNDLLGSGDASNNLRYLIGNLGNMYNVPTSWNFLGNGYAATVNVIQPVFAGGRILNGNALAALGVKAADLKKSMAERDNEDAVTEKYWNIVSLSEKKKALQQALDLVSSLERDVASAFEAGLAKESDLMQVKLKAKDLQSNMIRLKSGERLAKMDLFNYIGMEYSVFALDSISLSDGFDDLLSPDNYYNDAQIVAESMGESRLLDLSVQSKELEKKMVIGESLPQIGVGAFYGYMKFVGDPNFNGSVYATVKIPLSDWGKTAKKIQRYQNEIDKARNDKEYLEKQLFLKVNKEWIDLQCAWDQKMIAEEQVALAGMIESQKRVEYESGLCTMSELLQCQSELQLARSNYVDCSAAYCNALSEWNK